MQEAVWGVGHGVGCRRPHPELRRLRLPTGSGRRFPIGGRRGGGRCDARPRRRRSRPPRGFGPLGCSIDPASARSPRLSADPAALKTSPRLPARGCARQPRARSRSPCPVVPAGRGPYPFPPRVSVGEGRSGSEGLERLRSHLSSCDEHPSGATSLSARESRPAYRRGLFGPNTYTKGMEERASSPNEASKTLILAKARSSPTTTTVATKARSLRR